MSVSSTSRKSGPYIGNGVTVAFPFNFKVFSDSDVLVIQTNATGVEVTLNLGTNYTVALNADQDASPGGIVTLVGGALGENDFLTLSSQVQELQPLVLTNAGGFYPSVINAALDRLTILIQQVSERLSRTLSYGISSPLGDGALPSPVPNNIIGWNEEGNGFKNFKPVDNTLLSVELASSSGSSNIGFVQEESGAVSRNVQSKLRETLSLNDCSISAAENLYRDVLVPPGSFDAGSLEYLNNTYHGEGIITLGKLTHNLLNNQAPIAVDYSMIGDMTTIDAAINAGAAKAVFWGDSISEGISQIAYEDSFVGLICEYLKDSAPNVSWSFENYSIAGSATGDAANASYVGAASDSYPTQFYRTAGSTNVGNFQPGTDLWPSGSTIGKSWRQHIRDAAPDILFIAFGANETATAKTDFYNNLSSILVYIGGWTKIPSIVFVTNLCPTRSVAPWSTYQDQLRNIASITRQVARQNNHSLIDANRLHHVFRDGVDVCRPSKRLSYNFSGGFTDAWPSKWETSGSTPVVTGSYNLLFSSPGVTLKQDKARDVCLSASFTNGIAANSVFALLYRADHVGSNDNYTVSLITNSTASLSTCVLYYNLTPIASGTVATVSNGETVKIEVECVGSRHIVKVRGITSIDVVDFSKLDAGYYGIQWGSGSGVASNWVARVGSYRVVGAPRLTDAIVYGKVNDWLTNDASLGGDTFHHPTAIGHHAIYFGAALGLLKHLAFLCRRPKNKIVFSNASDTATSIAASDYIELTISGISNGSVFVTNSAADASIGASVTNIQIITGTSVVINFLKNGSTFLTQTLTLTGGGTFAVIASGSVSSKGGVKRHILSIVAIRV